MYKVVLAMAGMVIKHSNNNSLNKCMMIGHHALTVEGNLMIMQPRDTYLIAKIRLRILRQGLEAKELASEGDNYSNIDS